jgi:hypothetical protein
MSAIQREPVAYQPLRKVNAINRTNGNRAAVLTKADRHTIDRSFI